MQIEYEAKYENIDKDQIRSKLNSIGAQYVKPEILQKRIVFNLPSGVHEYGKYARVRDEGDRITMSIKMIEGDRIEDQKEICLNIDSFENAVEYLKILGCEQKAFQENLREKWIYKDIEITIDTWPFLETFVEIESDSEEKVKTVSELLGFDYNKAIFGAVDLLISKKYGISTEIINNKTPIIIFNMVNPWI